MSTTVGTESAANTDAGTSYFGMLGNGLSTAARSVASAAYWLPKKVLVEPVQSTVSYLPFSGYFKGNTETEAQDTMPSSEQHTTVPLGKGFATMPDSEMTVDRPYSRYDPRRLIWTKTETVPTLATEVEESRPVATVVSGTENSWEERQARRQSEMKELSDIFTGLYGMWMNALSRYEQLQKDTAIDVKKSKSTGLADDSTSVAPRYTVKEVEEALSCLVSAYIASVISQIVVPEHLLDSSTPATTVGHRGFGKASETLVN